jgi:hypothetical protein
LAFQFLFFLVSLLTLYLLDNYPKFLQRGQLNSVH